MAFVTSDKELTEGTQIAIDWPSHLEKHKLWLDHHVLRQLDSDSWILATITVSSGCALRCDYLAIYAEHATFQVTVVQSTPPMQLDHPPNS